jgi:hypothetical protein
MFAIVLAAAALAAFLYALTDPDLNLDLESFVVFAPIYAAAQAIERLLEPLASVLLPAQAEKEAAEKAKAEKQQTLTAIDAAIKAEPSKIIDGGTAALASLQGGLGLGEAGRADKEAAAKLAKRQSERALVFFAIASVISLALCAVLGLGIIAAMTDEPPVEYLRAIDIAITGIVIGAGTKPLHDLISRVEKAKDKAAAEAQAA